MGGCGGELKKLLPDSVSVVRATQGGDVIAGEATHVTVKALRDVGSCVVN